MTLEHNEAIVGSGLIKLAPPYWGKPRLASILVSFLEEVQVLEDAIWSYLDELDVDTCGRYVLERFAKIVGEPTRPADTETLRTYVKGRILANNSDGTATSICALVEALIGETGTLLEWQGHVKVLTPSEPSNGSTDLLDTACAAGVSSAWLTQGTFAWPDYNDASPPATGVIGVGTWSDYNETT